MRPTCPHCLKAAARCYCSLVRPLLAGPKVVLLVHPREDRSRRAVNTARMVSRCIPDAELLVGRDFRRHPRLAALLDDPAFLPLLLYPAPGATGLETVRLAAGRRPLLVVPDGSWLGTRQILRFSDNVARLRPVRLRVDRPSRMTFRRQPGADCLCTLEAVHAALAALQPVSPSGPPEALDGMLAVLHHVVAEQEALRAGATGAGSSGGPARPGRGAAAGRGSSAP